MNVFLIRHAHAGHRSSDPKDIYRPLSSKGFERAEELTTVFADHRLGRVLSSPATRCVQTVEPLAKTHELEVRECDELWEDATATDTLRLIEDNLKRGDLVVCSHGNIIPELLELLGNQGVPLDGHGCQKGSIWVLRHDGDRFINGRYLSKKGTRLNENR